MSPLKKKATISLKTRQQKDAYIERLDQAHVDYDVTVKRDGIFIRDVSYIITLKASDLKKVS